MSKALEDLLREEAEYSEQHKDSPEQPGTVASRPGGQRAKVYSIRLSEAEVTALEAAADRAGVKASALARTWIIERMASEGGLTDLHAVAAALADYSKRLEALAG